VTRVVSERSLQDHRPGDLTVVSAGGRDGRITIVSARIGPGRLVIAAALPFSSAASSSKQHSAPKCKWVWRTQLAGRPDATILARQAGGPAVGRDVDSVRSCRSGASELVETHRREKLEVDAGCTTVLITIFDSSHRH
jgi:hypothetical protein